MSKHKMNKKSILMVGSGIAGLLLVLVLFTGIEEELVEVSHIDLIEEIQEGTDLFALSKTCSTISGKTYCYTHKTGTSSTYSGKLPTIIGGVASIVYKIEYTDGTTTSGTVSQKIPIEFTKLSLYNTKSSPLKSNLNYKPVKGITLEIYGKTNTGEELSITSNRVGFTASVRTDYKTIIDILPFTYTPYHTNPAGKSNSIGNVLLSEVRFSSAGIEEMIRDKGAGLIDGTDVYIELRGKGDFTVKTKTNTVYEGSLDDLKIRIPFVYRPAQALVSGSVSVTSTTSGSNHASMQISTNPDEIERNMKLVANAPIPFCGKQVEQKTCTQIIQYAKKSNPFVAAEKWFKIRLF